MPIIGKWRNPAIRRCHNKASFPNMAIAERAAQRDSRNAGQLIIAYQCYECGRFHVGHADCSQLIARRALDERLIDLPTACPRCNGSIPEERRFAAAESGNSNVYCSNRCRDKHDKKRRQAKIAAQLKLTEEWMKCFGPEQKE